jgi:hypothetical protein
MPLETVMGRLHGSFEEVEHAVAAGPVDAGPDEAVCFLHSKQTGHVPCRVAAHAVGEEQDGASLVHENGVLVAVVLQAGIGPPGEPQDGCAPGGVSAPPFIAGAQPAAFPRCGSHPAAPAANIRGFLSTA